MTCDLPVVGVTLPDEVFACNLRPELPALFGEAGTHVLGLDFGLDPIMVMSSTDSFGLSRWS